MSRSLPRRRLQNAASSTPRKLLGIETMRICGMENATPVIPASLARIVAIDTTATETGDAVMPICAATDETAIGRSGRMFLLSEMSSMMGNIVYTTWPVPHRTVRNHVVKGARMVTRVGCLRNSFSAYFIITSRPPMVWRTEAQPMTARIVSMTSIGGSPGGSWKKNTRRARPMPLIRPSPTPP